MYSLGPSGVTIPFVHDRLVHSFIEGNVSYPQVPTGVVCFMAHTAVRAIVTGQFKWRYFERFAPSEKHVLYIGEVMDRVHRRDNIPHFTRNGISGEQGEVENERLLGGVFAFRNDSIAAVGSFARGMMRSQNPGYYDQPGYQGKYFDARPRFAREFFREQHMLPTRITPEIRALDILLEGVATDLRPTNREARRVKQELRAIHTLKVHPDISNDIQDKSARVLSVKDSLQSIITTSMLDRQGEVEEVLQYPLPMEAIEEFAYTAITGSQ